MYIPATQSSYAFVATHEDDNPMGQKLSISFAGNAEFMKKLKKPPVNESFLLAWDPVRQKEAWRVPMGTGRSGGTLATAGGLVFAGSSANEFVAYRADTGAKLWRADTQVGTMAGRSATRWMASSTWRWWRASARAAGGDYYAPHYSRLLVYKLGGVAKLPAPVPYTPPALNPPVAFGTAEQIKHGQEVYGTLCSTCHGSDGLSRGMFPDLRYSAALASEQAFKSIVIDGALTRNGMVSFPCGGDAGGRRSYSCLRGGHGACGHAAASGRGAWELRFRLALCYMPP